MEACVRRGNLPAEPTSFIGREHEIEIVTSMIGRFPLVTLTGVAGVGKTRLAFRVAERLTRAFPDGVWVADLSGEQHPDLVAHDVAAALGLMERSMRSQIEVLTDHLSGKKLLLVLDTCEHVLAACRTLVDALLRAAPQVRVLATSRQALGLAAETVYTVEPLPAPDPDSYGLDLNESSAVRLFLERARALDPGFDPDPREVARLCHLLDGIPLAIELAARRVRSMTIEQIANGLDDRFALLTGGSRTPIGRHRTLRTAVGWSHELLTADERLLWARLTVFADGFDAATAQAVCADERLPDIRGPLERLAYKSIVISKGSRHRMLSMVREYGEEWLRLLGEQELMARRQRSHYLLLARRAEQEWYGKAQVEWADWAHAEMPNLRGALDGALSDPASLELAGTLWFAWFCLGHAQEGRYYLDRVLAADPPPGPARTKALWAAALVAVAQGDTRTARCRASRAMSEARRRRDAEAVGYAAFTLGLTHLVGGDLWRAETLTRKAVKAFNRAAEAEAGLVAATITRALLFTMMGDHRGALALIEPERAHWEQQGELWASSYSDLVDSYIRLAEGAIAEARQSAIEALDAKWRLGDTMGCALAVDQLAAVAVARDNPEHAAYLLGVAQRMWTRFGRPRLGSAGLALRRERTEAGARRVLGDAAFDAAFRLGHTVDPAEAVACARDM